MSDDSVDAAAIDWQRPRQPGHPPGACGPEFDGISALRPYLITSGHVSPVDETLEIEAQVATTDLGLDALALVAFERRDILSVCMSTLSVAEIAAKLGLHLGVARVLVAELAAQGYVMVRRPGTLLGNDLATIERVIRGLERII
jgi:hypothetical protein